MVLSVGLFFAELKYRALRESYFFRSFHRSLRIYFLCMCISYVHRNTSFISLLVISCHTFPKN